MIDLLSIDGALTYPQVLRGHGHGHVGMWASVHVGICASVHLCMCSWRARAPPAGAARHPQRARARAQAHHPPLRRLPGSCTCACTWACACTCCGHLGMWLVHVHVLTWPPRRRLPGPAHQPIGRGGGERGPHCRAAGASSASHRALPTFPCPILPTLPCSRRSSTRRRSCTASSPPTAARGPSPRTARSASPSDASSPPERAARSAADPSERVARRR